MMNKTTTKKICKYCKEEFARPYHIAKRQQYCSKECAYKATHIYKICPYCEEEFRGKNRSVYCSRSCRNKANPVAYTKERRDVHSIACKGNNTGVLNPSYGKYGKDSWS